ncbi:PLP-dependent aminotransferase family protein [Microbacterium sp.]|uniref:MocR-like pyridoxine biosynthesis transcription factor PdxR n=1 Tax=Microbacterium sp. TaxID=51671 RepID=UPI002810AB41|nr:PLP-dependent aminotransferase family protein [Microbacterium sp.]
MQKTRPILAWETLLDLDSGADAGMTALRQPLRGRLERALRAAVAEGRLPTGAALPASRVMAETLGVSRWVVTEAYGQLVAEGVLEARTGSATRVAASAAPSALEGDSDARNRPAGVTLAGVTRPPTDARGPRAPRFDLRPGIPDLRATPRSRWSSALRSALVTLPDHELAAAHRWGYAPARIAVAEHLSRSRHAVAVPERVLLTHGAGDGMRILAEELHRQGHRCILVEDPSWPRLREIAGRAGLRPIPIPVDDDGIDVSALTDAASRSGARIALLTPAHQFPLGVALSAPRREQIVRWARDQDAILIEDDYDAEFRYDRRPIAALQRLAPDRVALLGSLSKSVSPALGIGWALLPAGIDPEPSASSPSLIDQAALARFILHGDFERHLRASRIRFRRRRARMLEALRTELPALTPSGIAAGMHLVLPLPPGCTAMQVIAAAPADLAITPLDRYAADREAPDALVLGYGNLDDALVEAAVARVAGIIRELDPGRR